MSVSLYLLSYLLARQEICTFTVLPYTTCSRVLYCRWNTHERKPHCHPQGTTERNPREDTHIRTPRNHQVFRRARQSVWWPGLSTQLEELVKTCKTCCIHQQQRAEPLIPSELPELPWQKVGTDLFEWKNCNYLLIVDYNLSSSK